jgi:hypothetical protein
MQSQLYQKTEILGIRASGSVTILGNYSGFLTPPPPPAAAPPPLS